MPLIEISPNMQESDAKTRKRSHDEFVESVVKGSGQEDTKAPATQPSGDLRRVYEPSDSHNAQISLVLPPRLGASSQLTPQGSPGLTETASSTPARNSPSPETPIKQEPATSSASKSSTTALKPSVLTAAGTSTILGKVAAQPPTKKIKPSTGEKEAQKEAREKEAADKKKERDEKAAAKAAERAKVEEEKAARAKEREEKKKKKEEEQKRAQEEKDEKKRKKEEEQKRVQEEKDKKARSQPTLGSFFKIPSTPKKPAKASMEATAIDQKSPVKNSKESRTEYEKLFKPFFVKENTTLACLGPKIDDETRQVKSGILDECIGGQRKDEIEGFSFDAERIFALPSKSSKRGMLHHPVKHIMEQVYHETEKAENADKLMREARKKLAKIPVKIIAFSRDVRPPYYGTMTFKTFALGQANMSQLARNPMSRRLPLEYDYDSEAEWQEDEEGEDVDMEDDEEEVEDEDDMDGFLDDSEDAGLSKRIFANAMEPDTTGICFENEKRMGPNASVYEHKMEIMHDAVGSCGIDPFSTKYWEPEPKAKVAKSSSSTEPSGKMKPPPAPANAFAALTNPNAPGDLPKLIKSELMDDVKKAILDNSTLSKVGIVDYIFQQFRDNVSRAEVKNTIEYVAEKTGTGRQKSWTLKPGHEIAS